MGRTPNLTSRDVFAKLVNLYPAAYRRRYGKPMVQTFEDMLAAEPGKTGRLAVWVRTLRDLPKSIIKEHITDGRGFAMSRNTKLVVAGVVSILILANAVSFWFGVLHSRQDTSVQSVTTAQLADAMQQDGFYSTYGNAALLFRGKVSAVHTQGGKTVATFETGRPYVVECQFTDQKDVKIGATLSVAAPAGSAKRLPQGVLLYDCVQS